MGRTLSSMRVLETKINEERGKGKIICEIAGIGPESLDKKIRRTNNNKLNKLYDDYFAEKKSMDDLDYMIIKERVGLNVNDETYFLGTKASKQYYALTKIETLLKTLYCDRSGNLVLNNIDEVNKQLSLYMNNRDYFDRDDCGNIIFESRLLEQKFYEINYSMCKINGTIDSYSFNNLTRAINATCPFDIKLALENDNNFILCNLQNYCLTAKELLLIMDFCRFYCGSTLSYRLLDKIHEYILLNRDKAYFNYVYPKCMNYKAPYDMADRANIKNLINNIIEALNCNKKTYTVRYTYELLICLRGALRIYSENNNLLMDERQKIVSQIERCENSIKAFECLFKTMSIYHSTLHDLSIKKDMCVNSVMEIVENRRSMLKKSCDKCLGNSISMSTFKRFKAGKVDFDAAKFDMAFQNLNISLKNHNSEIVPTKLEDLQTLNDYKTSKNQYFNGTGQTMFLDRMEMFLKKLGNSLSDCVQNKQFLLAEGAIINYYKGYFKEGPTISILRKALELTVEDIRNIDDDVSTDGPGGKKVFLTKEEIEILFWLCEIEENLSIKENKERSLYWDICDYVFSNIEFNQYSCGTASQLIRWKVKKFYREMNNMSARDININIRILVNQCYRYDSIKLLSELVLNAGPVLLNKLREDDSYNNEKVKYIIENGYYLANFFGQNDLIEKYKEVCTDKIYLNDIIEEKPAPSVDFGCHNPFEMIQTISL